MRIVDEYTTLIHTRFVTDGERLREEDRDKIERQMSLLLVGLRIVFGVRVEPPTREEGICVVLECRPIGSDLTAIRGKLTDVLEPIPVRPAVARVSVQSMGPYR